MKIGRGREARGKRKRQVARGEGQEKKARGKGHEARGKRPGREARGEGFYIYLWRDQEKRNPCPAQGQEGRCILGCFKGAVMDTRSSFRISRPQEGSLISHIQSGS
jgi:hypothetical protein